MMPTCLQRPAPSSPSSARPRLRSLAAALLASLALSAAPACSRPRPQETLALENGPEAVYPFLSKGSVAVASGMLRNEWNLGKRFPVVTLEHLTWTEDPLQDNYWRFLFYSLRPTSHLLWAYYTTGKPAYREKLLEILESYAAYDAQRPAAYDRRRFDYRHGAGFRALVLVNTYMKLRRTADLPADLAASLRASLERLGGFLSLPENFDGTYNHGFAEAAGLAAIAWNFPEMPDAAEWQRTALDRLRGLMSQAVDADGVELENSPFYHFYVLGFAYDITHWAEANGVPLSPEFEAAMHRMVRYATQIVQPSGELPLLGATVEYGVENLDAWAFEALAAEEPEFDWVFTRGESGRPSEERAALFPASGQVVLRSGFGAGPDDFVRQSQVTLNAGPWRTSHSHLDVLGVNVYASGGPVLCDSGLFTYEPGTDADYFTSTRAHNTVVVDGGDQLPIGPIGVGRTATGEDWEYQSAWHALYSGVVHRRSVLLLGRDALLVYDALDGGAAHDFAQTWHLPPGDEVALAGAAADASGAGPPVAIRQAWPDGLSVAARTGAMEPMQGWFSAAYGLKQANTAVEYHAQASSARYATLVVSGPAAAAAPAIGAAVDPDGTMRATICVAGARRTVAISAQAAEDELVTVSAAEPGACP